MSRDSPGGVRCCFEPSPSTLVFSSLTRSQGPARGRSPSTTLRSFPAPGRHWPSFNGFSQSFTPTGASISPCPDTTHYRDNQGRSAFPASSPVGRLRPVGGPTRTVVGFGHGRGYDRAAEL